jgi:integrase
MKAKAELSARNGYACLERVAEHLYRHRLNGSYYGRMKVAGKRIIKALRIAEDTAPTTDRPTANRLLREWEDSLSRVDASSGDMRLEALLAKFAAARAGKAQSTRITEAALISRFRADFGRNEEGRRVFGMDQMVSRVKPSDVSLFLAGIANSGVRNATHNRYRLILRKLFQFAVDDRVIAQSPFIEGRNPPKKKQKVFRNIPTAAEFEKIINDIRTPTLRPTKGKHGGARMMSFPESADFAEFLGRAGLGQAEAQALKWGHVDFKNRRLKIVRRKTGEYFEVPIYAALLPLLERMHKEAKDTSPEADVFSIKKVHKSLMNACKRLGLPHFTERNLRAMKIRELYEAGVDVKTIARWQGHRDGGKLIMEIYTEIFRSNDDYEAQQLAKADGKIIPFAAEKAA